MVLKQKPKEIHLFEPIQKIYLSLFEKYDSLIEQKLVNISSFALFSKIGEQQFYYYAKHPTLSTIYRRIKAEETEEHDIGLPNKPISVVTTTIDYYCGKRGVEHINYLKIDTEGAEFDVMRGADKFLTEHRIDFVEFEYGGTYLDAGITLRQVYDFLNKKGYRVFRATRTDHQFIPSFSPKLEDYKYSIFIAIAPNIRFKR